MSAVWMRARAELRQRRRSVIAMMLLVGLAGGAALAAVAGALRTETAYGRFLRAHAASDLLSADAAGEEGEGRPIALDEIARFPVVEAAEKLRFYLLRNPAVPLDGGDDAFLTAQARSPERAGDLLDTGKVLEGRLPDPSAVDEAAITIPGSKLPGLKVGATLVAEGLAPEFPDFARALQERPITLRIVGRVAYPGDFPPQTGDETVALRLTPAFYDAYPEVAFGFPSALVLRLADVPGAADRYRESFQAIGGNPYFTIERDRQHDNVQRSFHLQALALWVLAGVGGVAFALIFGQLFARQIAIESDDVSALRALGMSRGQIAAAMVLRVAIVAAGGAAIAVAVAFAASPLAPAGLARVAEPTPGFSFDGAALGLGAVALVAAVLLLVAWPAYREARVRREQIEAGRRISRAAEMVARAGRSPAAVAGTRLALERGRGSSAMPVRSTIASLVLGIAGLAAGATFATSLDSLLGTPPLYGVTWDQRIGIEVETDVEALARRLRADAGEGGVVRGVSIGETNIDAGVGEELLEVMTIAPVAGSPVLPPLLEGAYPRTRAPGETQEIVLGRRAARVLGAGVGGTIEAGFFRLGVEEHTLRVVGIAVVPVHSAGSPLGMSGMMTPLGLTRAAGLSDDGGEFPVSNLFVSGDVTVAHVASLIPGAAAEQDVHVWPRNPPTDIVNFGDVQGMPLFAGALLALFALATLVHTLVSAIRRRARDLAILKTLGFVDRQVRRAVHIQASLLAALALCVGLPAGFAAGRWLWVVFADGAGLVTRPVLSVVAVVAGTAAAFAGANLVSLFPARTAARTNAAALLRSP